VKVSSAVIRAKSGVFTAGLANPLVATVETVGSFAVAVAAILIPVLCVCALLLLVFIVRRRRKALS
jgi:hypothetical protein